MKRCGTRRIRSGVNAAGCLLLALSQAQGAVPEGQYISLAGRLHVDARAWNKSVDGANQILEVRRARLGVEGAFNPWLEFEVNGDFSSSGITLDTGSAGVILGDALQIHAGRLKTPFGLEISSSSNVTDFLERSMLSALAPGKQDGLRLQGSPGKGIQYGLALIKGAEGGSRTTANNSEVVGRLAVNLAHQPEPSSTVLHLALAHSRTTLPAGSSVPDIRTEARGTDFFEVEPLASPTALRRLNLELAAVRGSWKLQGEWLRYSLRGPSPAGASFRRDLDAGYAEVAWLLTGESHAAAYRGGVFKQVSPQVAASGLAGGAWQLGLRASYLDASDFTSSALSGTGRLAAGRANGAWAITGGVGWIRTENVRLLLNVVHTRFGQPVRSEGAQVPRRTETALALRSQVSF